jgi:hypothetical protein
VSEQGRPSQKSVGLNGIAAFVCMIVWWWRLFGGGGGKKHGGLKVRARNIQIQVGQVIF